MTHSFLLPDPLPPYLTIPFLLSVTLPLIVPLITPYHTFPHLFLTG